MSKYWYLLTVQVGNPERQDPTTCFRFSAFRGFPDSSDAADLLPGALREVKLDDKFRATTGILFYFAPFILSIPSPSQFAPAELKVCGPNAPGSKQSIV